MTEQTKRLSRLDTRMTISVFDDLKATKQINALLIMRLQRVAVLNREYGKQIQQLPADNQFRIMVEGMLKQYETALTAKVKIVKKP